MLQGKHIVLGITGGIAAYKSVMLLRLLVKAGAEVQVVMTPAAKEFVTPVTFSCLSGKPVVSEFFTANTGVWNSHVDLGLWSDLMVVAPATASSIGKMATGVADNMLITTYLSAKADVMIAPAMDLDMWSHPTTQRNLQTLVSDGVKIIAPATGELASGLEGKGRMAEPTEIFAEIEKFFSGESELTGCNAIVTAGPTFENIDPVRFIGNYSSGKMGFEIARELAKRGAKVTLITGPVSLPTPDSPLITRIDIKSAQEMLRESEKVFPQCDLAIFAAAVSDYAPVEVRERKIKREGEGEIILKLKNNPDIAASLGKVKSDNQITVGFALETDNEIENAITKLKSKHFNLIVLNSMNDPEAGFMKDTNKITLVDNHGNEETFPAKLKREVAKDIIDAILRYRKGLS